MALVRGAVASHAEQICAHLSDDGYACIDGFLPPPTVARMRAEAEALLAAGELETSQSMRWDEDAGHVVSYAKHNVMATSLGLDKYELTPRLSEYVVSLVSSLTPRLNAHSGGSLALNEAAATNKLAVCLGDSSTYDKHIDNMGGNDLRKLTVLLYLQERGGWEPAMGGEFRMYSSEASEGVDVFEDIPPVGGRLLAFWSDVRVHSVCPSFAPAGAEQHRWALTVWLHTADPAAVSSDAALEALHFAEQQHGQG